MGKSRSPASPRRVRVPAPCGVDRGTNGASVTLKVTYRVPGGGGFRDSGQTTTVRLVKGQTSYAFSINMTSGVPANANTIRI